MKRKEYVYTHGCFFALHDKKEPHKVHLDMFILFETVKKFVRRFGNYYEYERLFAKDCANISEEVFDMFLDSELTFAAFAKSLPFDRGASAAAAACELLVEMKNALVLGIDLYEKRTNDRFFPKELPEPCKKRQR